MTTNDHQIFNEVLALGCCKRCALRCLADKNVAHFDSKIYSNPDTTIADFGYLVNTNKDEDQKTVKKLKKNSCCVCLGVLEDEILNQMMEHRSLRELEQYACKECVMYVGLPTCVMIRERSLEIYLHETFPEFYKTHEIIPINKIWRWSINNRFTEITKKNYNRRAKLSIQFVTSYSLDDEETNIMHKIRGIIPDLKRKKKYQNLSRHVVKDILERTHINLFKKLIQVPPRIPIESVKLQSVDYSSNNFLAAGTYCKYSRLLYQKPGKLDDIKITNDYSVQSIIEKGVKDVLNHDGGIEFVTVGTEDYDVRVLGNGRPFYINILNPKFDTITCEQFRQIEEEIKKSDAIEVKNFQLMNKHETKILMNGELNPKTYNLLCKMDESLNLEYYSDLITKMKDVEISQRTPANKVYPKRDDKKTKMVYSMKAKKVEDKPGHLMIEIYADSGLYISEFISGDDGRTTPSLRDLIKQQIDLVELDIIDIFLNLPKIS